MELRKRVAENIATVRKRMGWTQEKLARLLGVNKQTVWRIESGLTNLSIDTLEAVARELSVSPTELLLADGAPSVHDHRSEQVKDLLEHLTMTCKALKAYRSELAAAR